MKKRKISSKTAKKKFDKNLIPSKEGECWKHLKTSIYPEIKGYYYISNMNRVFNSKTLKFVHVWHVPDVTCESCYWKVSLQTKKSVCGKSSKTYFMHRLMMIRFKPRKNMKSMIINHKDAVKLNNDLNNMEWTTTRGNAIHARDNGLLHPRFGENHADAKISEAQAREIVKLLCSKKYSSYKDIGEKLGIPYTIVADIARKSSWKHLTKGIPDSELRTGLRSPVKFSYDDIHNLCKYFQNNPKPSDMSVRKYITMAFDNIGYNDYGEGMINSARSLYNKERFVDISSNYSF